MFYIRAMRITDLPGVMPVNRRCFTNAWSEKVFRIELTESRNSHWMILETEAPNVKRNKLWSLFSKMENPYKVAGFCGFWLLKGEAHISNICVDKPFQGRGLGELLLTTMLKKALLLQAEWTSLEVRISNYPAMMLYEKYRYKVAGRKPHYYRDNGEDAYWMIAKPLNEDYGAMLDENIQKLTERLHWKDYFLPEEIKNEA